MSFLKLKTLLHLQLALFNKIRLEIIKTNKTLHLLCQLRWQLTTQLSSEGLIIVDGQL